MQCTAQTMIRLRSPLYLSCSCSRACFMCLQPTHTTACVLYQKGIFDPIVIAGETMTGVEIRQNLNASQTVLDIMILDRAEGISLRLEYIETLYERESMERFGKLLARIIQEITEAVTEQKIPESPP